NSSTRIDYEVADVGGRLPTVLVQVFNLLGEKIKTLASGKHPSGRYSVTWDGTDDRGGKVPSGTYYYRLISGDYASGKKMILLK
ncbi:MAG: FlgD immunoglobulin-like domain containing protein, partial [Bacteroidota bacterium]